MSDNRPALYTENEHIIVRASSIGRSAHVLAAALCSVTPLAHSARTQGYFHEGELHEPDILERLAVESGYLVASAGDEQIGVDFPISLTPSIIARCHPDGFLTRDGQPQYVVETKSMSKDVFAKWLAVGFKSNYAYACQFTIEMLATGLPGVFAVKDRNSGEMKWKAYVEPPVSLDEIRGRMLRVWAAAMKGDLDPFPDEKCDQWGCVYSFLHPAKPEVMTAADDVLDGLADLYNQARDREQQAKKMKDDAREKLLLAMGDRERAKTLRYGVAVSSVERRTLDKVKLAEVVGDLGAFETVSVSQQVRVTAVKDEG